MLPFLGFVTACIVFGAVGSILLKVLPRLELTPWNLFLFLVGALPGSLVFGGVYRLLVTDQDGLLTSTISEYGLLACILIGGVLIGLAAVLLGNRVLTAIYPNHGKEGSERRHN